MRYWIQQNETYFSEIEQELFIEDKIRDDMEKHDSIIYTYWCLCFIREKNWNC